MHVFSEYLTESPSFVQQLQAQVRPLDRLVASTRSTFVPQFTIPQLELREMSPGYKSKPLGLWYGIGTSWVEWAEDEGFGIGQFFYKIKIRREKMLWITPDNLAAVSRRYPGRDAIGDRVIHWQKVAQEYSGVEFNPYKKYANKATWNSMWYSGVDVPSGCIWKSDAITSAEPVYVDLPEK